MIQKKQWKKGALAAAGAGIMLVAACGNGPDAKATPGPDGAQGSQVTQTPGGVTPDAADSDVTSVTPPSGPSQGGEDTEQGGVDTEQDMQNKTDDEKVVLDTVTGMLMYRGVNYQITGDDTMSIVDYYDIDITRLVIPDELEYDGKTYRVTEIGEDVFAYFYDLVSVEIGSNIEVIGKTAFQGCDDLVEVTFRGAPRIIGDSAFSSCERLVSIELPEGVESLGEEAFCSCYALEQIKLPNTLETVGNDLFFDCTLLKRVELPASLKNISYGMFTNCYALEEVVIPEGVVTIGQESFWACESLTEIVLPESMMFIGNQAFYNSGLKNITFPENRVSFGDNIFDYCEFFEIAFVRESTAEYYESVLEDYECEIIIM